MNTLTEDAREALKLPADIPMKSLVRSEQIDTDGPEVSYCTWR
jgi:hypothetical protein